MKKKFPVISLLTLTAIVILCLACSPMMTKDPLYMDLAHCNEAPGKNFSLARTKWAEISFP